jgi:hypothetical protein
MRKDDGFYSFRGGQQCVLVFSGKWGGWRWRTPSFHPKMTHDVQKLRNPTPAIEEKTR